MEQTIETRKQAVMQRFEQMKKGLNYDIKESGNSIRAEFYRHDIVSDTLTIIYDAEADSASIDIAKVNPGYVTGKLGFCILNFYVQQGIVRDSRAFMSTHTFNIEHLFDMFDYFDNCTLAVKRHEANVIRNERTSHYVASVTSAYPLQYQVIGLNNGFILESKSNGKVIELKVHYAGFMLMCFVKEHNQENEQMAFFIIDAFKNYMTHLGKFG